jgi:hypothetical protein
MDAPQMCAVRTPSSSMRATTSSAMSASVKDRSGASLCPAPRLSRATTSNSAARAGIWKAHEVWSPPQPMMSTIEGGRDGPTR